MHLLTYITIIFGLILSCSCTSKPEPKALPKTENLEAALGMSFFNLLSNPDKITAFKVAPKPPSLGVTSYQPSSASVVLSKEASKKLLKVLLDDNNYHFDISKKCLFIPTFALVFSKENETLSVYVSLSCQQLKFLNGDRALLLDYDPAKQLFEENFNNLPF